MAKAGKFKQNIHKQRFRPPWIERLSRVPRRVHGRHPQTLIELSEYEHPSPFFGFLRHSADGLRSHWRPNWREVLVIGPFIGRRDSIHSVASIPFVLYGDIRSIVVSLDAVSNALADSYTEFGILPDIFIFKESFVRELEESDNWNWTLTRRLSISIEA
jgi:hypothetical protein